MRKSRDNDELQAGNLVWFVDVNLKVVSGTIDSFDPHNNMAMVLSENAVYRRGWKPLSALYSLERNALVECLDSISRAQITTTRALERCLADVDKLLHS